ncbi:hypothetical protein D2T30_17380 [Sinirhodobacter populi]|uniref:Uncharacterized protein n=1 Tax=Paenirhodobacter populi TaxID=2306993 RepID=A0A443JBV4_9RHOB|nr:hypothetical protein D2T30_17380 [Sinirhodobacter populi]
MTSPGSLTGCGRGCIRCCEGRVINEALKRRGSLLIWLDQNMGWLVPKAHPMNRWGGAFGLSRIVRSESGGRLGRREGRE